MHKYRYICIHMCTHTYINRHTCKYTQTYTCMHKYMYIFQKSCIHSNNFNFHPAPQGLSLLFSIPYWHEVFGFFFSVRTLNPQNNTFTYLLTCIKHLESFQNCFIIASTQTKPTEKSSGFVCNFLRAPLLCHKLRAYSPILCSDLAQISSFFLRFPSVQLYNSFEI